MVATAKMVVVLLALALQEGCPEKTIYMQHYFVPEDTFCNHQGTFNELTEACDCNDHYFDRQCGTYCLHGAYDAALASCVCDSGFSSAGCETASEAACSPAISHCERCSAVNTTLCIEWEDGWVSETECAEGHYGQSCLAGTNCQTGSTKGCEICQSTVAAVCLRCEDKYQMNADASVCVHCDLEYGTFDGTDCWCYNPNRNRQNGCTTCLPWYQMTDTGKCISCMPEYGVLSGEVCVCNVANSDPKQGCKLCRNGWIGEACNICSSNWAGQNCDHCAMGWAGGLCDVCALGWAGKNCDVCAPGYYGDYCSPGVGCAEINAGCLYCLEDYPQICLQCAENYTSIQNSGRCRKCTNGDVIDNKCICHENFEPRNNCDSCIYGFMGENCDVEIPYDCEYGYYDQDLDMCTCWEGYFGELCDKLFCDHGVSDAAKENCICDEFYYGNVCDFLCVHGYYYYYGYYDERICECAYNYEGSDCNTVKQLDCVHGAFNAQLAVCECQTNYQGELCELEGGAGCSIIINHCMECSVESTEECIQWAEGWTNEYTCAEGYHGDQCLPGQACGESDAENCQYCLSSNTAMCLSCKSYYLLSSVGVCVHCKNGVLADDDTCTCMYGFDSATGCTSCQSGYYGTTCAEGTECSGIGPDNCTYCRKGSLGQCLVCTPGYLANLEGKCVHCEHGIIADEVCRCYYGWQGAACSIPRE